MNTDKQSSYVLILQQTSVIKKTGISFRKIYPAFLILMILIIASFFIRHFSHDSIDSNLKNEFNKTTGSITNRMNTHISKQYEVLNSMSGLYDVLIEVSKDYFELYATVPVKNYPSIMSVGYAEEVVKESIFDFVLKIRNLGHYYYDFSPIEDKKIYYPFVHIFPQKENINKHQSDLSIDKVALDAIIKARDKNAAVSTEIYKIRKPDTMGFFVLIPIYKFEYPKETLDERRENFVGVLTLEMDLNKFVKEALSGDSKNEMSSAPADTSIIFEIISKDENGNKFVAYKSDNHNLLGSYEPYLSKSESFVVADQSFEVRFYTIPDYGGKFQQILPNLAFAISLILSFAMFGFVYTQMTNKARAQAIAEKMTRSQRRIVDTSNDIIAVLDNNLNWKSMNPASLAILGIMPDNMTGKSFGANLVEKDFEDKLKSLFMSSKEDNVERYDIKMQKADGNLVWINWSFTFSPSDSLIYCIGRDVTLEKLAEQEAKIRSKQIEATEIKSREANYSKTFFMKELSHQLRNSLTGILGYLELLREKVYENEEELEMYVGMAATSSEELFIYVTDIDEAARLDQIQDTALSLENIKLKKAFDLALEYYNENNEIKLNDKVIKVSEEISNSVVSGDKNSIKDVIATSLQILGAGADSVTFDINIENNPHEGAVELQILSSGNKTVCDLIEIYRKNSQNIFESLRFDTDDVLLNILKVESTMRLLRGNFKIDTFGEKDGNLISIMFKAPKKTV
ncbi:hypothetical protein MASR1M45_29850 [Candidatus Kapaibacterium sp.]